MMPQPQLWPVAAAVDGVGRMTVGGCALTALAQEYGTPLYVLDIATIRAACAAYRTALADSYPGPSAIHYAGKALLNIALAGLMRDEGLGLDVVSGGELAVGR
jgi:diaminopimelate decarboxylase